MITFSALACLGYLVFRPLVTLLYNYEDNVLLVIGVIAIICWACRILLGVRIFSILAVLAMLLFCAIDVWVNYQPIVVLAISIIFAIIITIACKSKIYHKLLDKETPKGIRILFILI